MTNRNRVKSIAIVSSLLVGLCLASPALAQKRGRGNGKGNNNTQSQAKAGTEMDQVSSSAQQLGLDIDEPLVLECVALVEAGKAEEGVNKLKAALNDKNLTDPEKRTRLRLGYAIVCLRAGQIKEAMSSVSDLIGPENPKWPKYNRQARALRSSIDQARNTNMIPKTKPEPGQEAAKLPLAEEEAWKNVLKQVRQRLQREIDDLHSKLENEINQKQFRTAEARLTEINKLLNELIAIRSFVNDKPNSEVYNKHLTRLKNHLEKLRSTRSEIDLKRAAFIRDKNRQGKRATDLNSEIEKCNQQIAEIDAEINRVSQSQIDWHE